MSRRVVLGSLVLAALAGCVVPDADPPGAVVGLALTPAATTLDVFHVQVTGAATFAYTSDAPALLELWVDGAPVSQLSLSVSTALTAPIDVVVPVGEGPNEVVGTLTYQGESVTRRFTVTAAMTAPTITLPSWTSTYTAHLGMAVTGRIQVAAATAYRVAAVDVAVDGGAWMPAVAANGDGWDATLVDPDIGSSDVAVKVTTTVDGHAQDTIAHGAVQVAPVFSCAASSMLPDTRLIENSRVEVRTMVGYFGRPGGGHAVSFQLAANSPALPGNPRISVASQVVTYGTTSIVASFAIEAYRCETNQGSSCDLPYDLTLWVDGATQPSWICPAFGVIRRYN